MLCWLVFGDHTAFRRDAWRAANVILTEGIPHFACRIRPAHDRAITPPRLPLGRPKCFAGSYLGDHAALRKDVWRAANVILTKGIPHFACRFAPRMIVIPPIAPPSEEA